jgi:hypothetical protein
MQFMGSNDPVAIDINDLESLFQSFIGDCLTASGVKRHELIKIEIPRAIYIHGFKDSLTLQPGHLLTTTFLEHLD